MFMDAFRLNTYIEKISLYIHVPMLFWSIIKVFVSICLSHVSVSASWIIPIHIELKRFGIINKSTRITLLFNGLVMIDDTQPVEPIC